MRMAQGQSPIRCGHYASWLGYAYLQQGKVNEARMALGACRSTLESHAAMEHPGMSMDPDSSLSSSFANMRLRYLVDTDDWRGEIAGWALPKTAGPGARLDFAFARALLEIELGKAPEVQFALGELETIGREVSDLETKKANPNPSYRVRPAVMLLEAQALFAERESDLAKAEGLYRQAVALEETLPIDFGPPIIDKPTHELLGEFLLRRDGRKDEARTEFEKALARTPGRRLAEQGLAAAGK